ncbi:MAG TPA: SCP2 sterol-binding domain-containing protein [Amaricoccus sp.]|uniref:SCP2 sterol-binding domain-containing protein n=1 Tax=Amaricoccus sp. TaxID=1872485 RepID=UPI002C080D16|nr:SCP2 sterol-binding domain-containing protein [Amaricoccus sp.]HMQ92930.1 SCP2 sterol-binding domain-containing protein [Amaricoccus sp.]HMR52456.1 SCP2 sterol-binding domain-containing protein [Amaricoccus sp.]HMR59383.1 SCP2 sterol-binding domain-containing protein [Amaricoccus sp.]HMT99388.1 SCP2 sterol-binding domain-containing protein [Amaricoccus sp.]
MSDIVAAAVKTLNEKLDGEGIDGSVKFVIEDEGAVRIDESGASADDSEADCVMTANRETFEGMLGGEIDPTSAFMSGRLKVEGDMGLAMKLGSLLA